MKKHLRILSILVLTILLFPSSLAFGQEDINLNSYIVIDSETGYVLYENNPDIPYAPASITKVMTMYLIFEALESGQISKDEIVVPGEQVRTVQRPGNSQIFIEPGSELFTVDELIKAIAVPSGSDAAIAMAEHIAGSEINFVTMMNDKARELGLTNTQFRNPHGLDSQDHYMSARDIATLSRRLVVDFPDVTNYSRQQIYNHPPTQKDAFGGSYAPQPSTFRNLLRRHPEVDGLKTGYTSQAGYCITATANLSGRKYIIVLMGAESVAQRETYVGDFMRSIGNEFQPLSVSRENDTIKDIAIPRARDNAYPVGTLKDVSIVVPRSNPAAEQVITLNDGIKAPLSKGDEVGTITYVVGEQEVYSVPLYVLEDVPQANIFMRFFRGIGSFFSWIYNTIRNTFF
ncbi:D-alanyl-D-alanine carboxypeptidase [Alkalicella caledoniensis]|uniref:serine-type D-Ala-D-Ala carboxypeptidase n=1 Tax=Alkalicella caledoniensis TaxID=2731377 RepID=A0A7G9WC18_ALKCA|nr:D-alanyl-D-alanine carboxypeptidase family protein [Alkalicella caledoniensis]QNO16230.1 D-alanyl-D-alanine carboxypeptidase [Alkalicella caledoniensis]